MENSALNQAHQQSRRAEAHLRARRFDEAASCHKKAADLLAEAMTSTKMARAVESLSLQQQHHLRQTEVIRLKKNQYEKYCQVVETQRHKNAVNAMLERVSSGSPELEFPTSNLQVAIYRTMEEADSLMDRLIHRSDEESLKEVVKEAMMEPPVVKGSKQPKDDKMVVEELRTLTQHLHGLVVQLVTQLDASNQENEILRAQLRHLTSTQADVSSLTSSTQPSVASSSTATNNAAPSIMTDSNSSPFVLSPCSNDLSPDVTPTTSQPVFKSLVADRTLPILAPLEMPQFDFSVFQKTAGDQATLKTPDMPE